MSLPYIKPKVPLRNRDKRRFFKQCISIVCGAGDKSKHEKNSPVWRWQPRENFGTADGYMSYTDCSNS